MSEENKKPTENTDKPNQENSQNKELSTEDLDKVTWGIRQRIVAQLSLINVSFRWG